MVGHVVPVYALICLVSHYLIFTHKIQNQLCIVAQAGTGREGLA